MKEFPITFNISLFFAISLLALASGTLTGVKLLMNDAAFIAQLPTHALHCLENKSGAASEECLQISYIESLKELESKFYSNSNVPIGKLDIKYDGSEYAVLFEDKILKNMCVIHFFYMRLMEFYVYVYVPVLLRALLRGLLLQLQSFQLALKPIIWTFQVP
jgi:hypothetical protein